MRYSGGMSLIGYARCSTDEQDLTAQRQLLQVSVLIGSGSTLIGGLPAGTGNGLVWIRPWLRCVLVTPWWCPPRSPGPLSRGSSRPKPTSSSAG